MPDELATLRDLTAVMGRDGTSGRLVVSYLDAIDEKLLDYLDDEGELPLDVFERLRCYSSRTSTSR